MKRDLEIVEGELADDRLSAGRPHFAARLWDRSAAIVNVAMVVFSIGEI